MIDIKNYRQYTSKELQELAYNGLLEYNGADLSSFLEYFCQWMISEEEAERIALAEGERAYDEGYADGAQEEKDAQRWA